MLPAYPVHISRHESYDSFNIYHVIKGGSCDHSSGQKISKLPRINYDRSWQESFEAPAALHGRPTPLNSVSSESSVYKLIQLEKKAHANFKRSAFKDLEELVEEANAGLQYGINPTLADGAMGGTYFLRGEDSMIKIVCKPGDEEPNSPHNPYQHSAHPTGWGSWYKGHILPGFGMYREVAAFFLDRGYAGVPPTLLARVREDILNHESAAPHARVGYKLCSVQSFVRNECSAEDMGPARFSTADVQRIAALDIRLCNLDRHEGNMLVCVCSPYLTRTVPLVTSARSEDEIEGTTEDETSSERDMFNCDMDRGSPTWSAEGSGSGRDTMSPPSSVSESEEAGRYRLVPIDHGYTLPHVLYMGDPSLAWMLWPQSAAPIGPALLAYIASLDFKRDAVMLERAVGAALPATSLLTLEVCTLYLQRGAAAGLTLRELGKGMCPPADDPAFYSSCTRTSPCSATATFVSPLQQAVHVAVHRTLCTCDRCCREDQARSIQLMRYPKVFPAIVSLSQKSISVADNVAVVSFPADLVKSTGAMSIFLSDESAAGVPDRDQGTFTSPSTTATVFDTSCSPTAHSQSLLALSPSAAAQFLSTQPHDCPHCRPGLTVSEATVRVDEISLQQALRLDGGEALSRELVTTVTALVAELQAKSERMQVSVP